MKEIVPEYTPGQEVLALAKVDRNDRFVAFQQALVVLQHDKLACLGKLLLRRRIRACLLRCAPLGSSTCSQARLRGPRSRALYPCPPSPPRYES
ncbi:MAG: hypothetical protein ABSH28_07700 [Acidobacteriota bacterium]